MSGFIGDQYTNKTQETLNANQKLIDSEEGKGDFKLLGENASNRVSLLPNVLPKDLKEIIDNKKNLSTEQLQEILKQKIIGEEGFKDLQNILPKNDPGNLFSRKIIDEMLGRQLNTLSGRLNPNAKEPYEEAGRRSTFIRGLAKSNLDRNSGIFTNNLENQSSHFKQGLQIQEQSPFLTELEKTKRENNLKLTSDKSNINIQKQEELSQNIKGISSMIESDSENKSLLMKKPVQEALTLLQGSNAQNFEKNTQNLLDAIKKANPTTEDLTKNYENKLGSLLDAYRDSLGKSDKTIKQLEDLNATQNRSLDAQIGRAHV